MNLLRHLHSTLHICHDRISLCGRIRQLGPSLDLVASDLSATDRTRLQVCKVQMLPPNIADIWPFLSPTGVHVLSDSGDFQHPTPPLSALSCSSADLGIHGCQWVWAVREGVSPLFLRAVLVFCVPSPPT